MLNNIVTVTINCFLFVKVAPDLRRKGIDRPEETKQPKVFKFSRQEVGFSLIETLWMYVHAPQGGLQASSHDFVHSSFYDGTS